MRKLVNLKISKKQRIMVLGVFVLILAAVYGTATAEVFIDFEGYSEYTSVSTVPTGYGDVSFYMVSSDPLVGLLVGQTGDLTPDGRYPIIAEPDNKLPDYTNLVAFTVNMGNFGGTDPYRDDYVRDDGGTGAGGMLLTDPLDEGQTLLLQHAYSQFLAIVIDVSDICGVQGLNLVAIDFDHNEVWHFQYFDTDNTLIYEYVMGPASGITGDGAAFLIEYSNPEISKVAIWGANNLGERERIGYAIDNVAIEIAEPPGVATPGYWKNHPDDWPVEEITIGGVPYNKDDAISYMNTPPKGDMTYVMFNALVSAKLNVAACNPSDCIDGTIAAADTWMVNYGPVGAGVTAGGPDSPWREGEPLKNELDAYNNGLMCAPSRD